ncbi:MAG: MarR family transcriptional regulator [Rhodoferax sp.]|uniref:MarR family winged helix-turn-helix transcriptional regulator n=1 Tax=Rhodoferax sp. TaxID=50421 RepID=UPI00271D3A45|nr:MarR family transcriptional regulator [Rhodoferax sp.]MDO8449692.1 MarR family transcriptional regulator [Rhodoferax sp.]MDO9165841.1 MarR family transcriptional regulator [Rhodoferax sp.]
MAPIDITLILEQAQRRLSRELDRVLSEVGAPAEQWRVLDKLSDESGRPIGELAQQLSMNPPTMTKLIDRMVAAGLVQRIVDDEDSRRVLVFITDAGLVLFGKLSQKATEFHEGLAESLNAREALQLSKLLGHLTNRLN